MYLYMEGIHYLRHQCQSVHTANTSFGIIVVGKHSALRFDTRHTLGFKTNAITGVKPKQFSPLYSISTGLDHCQDPPCTDMIANIGHPSRLPITHPQLDDWHGFL